MDKELVRYLEAQNHVYLKALSEIRNGKKVSHWMWFIFPQVKGLGQSEASKLYGITDLEEARAYLQHPVLGKHLIEISQAVLNIEGKSAKAIFGTPDDMKLHSSMTLFAKVPDADPVFEKVLDKYYGSSVDELTLQILNRTETFL